MQAWAPGARGGGQPRDGPHSGPPMLPPWGRAVPICRQSPKLRQVDPVPTEISARRQESQKKKKNAETPPAIGHPRGPGPRRARWAGPPASAHPGLHSKPESRGVPEVRGARQGQDAGRWASGQPAAGVRGKCLWKDMRGLGGRGQTGTLGWGRGALQAGAGAVGTSRRRLKRLSMQSPKTRSHPAGARPGERARGHGCSRRL